MSETNRDAGESDRGREHDGELGRRGGRHQRRRPDPCPGGHRTDLTWPSRADRRQLGPVVPPAKAEGAFIALAAGDALGWPQEMPRRVRGEAGGGSPSLAFRTWTRLSGRFGLYDEHDFVRSPSLRGPASRWACATQVRIAWDDGSNSRAKSSGVRPARTRKPLDQQPIGWEADMNDGVRISIRPFMSAELAKGGRAGAGLLRAKPKIAWGKDGGKEVLKPRKRWKPPWLEDEASEVDVDEDRELRPRQDYPWFWGCRAHDTLTERTDFLGELDFDGNRWNDHHCTNAIKRAARSRNRYEVSS